MRIKLYAKKYVHISLRIISGVLQLKCFIDRLGNSLVIIQSDHGTVRKARPLVMVRYPGAPDRELQTASHLVELLDITPTILDALGLPLTGPDGSPLDGQPLRLDDPRLRGEIRVRVISPPKE